MAEHEYRPGDDVPRSGIYSVVHHGHREAHEAVVLKGAVFPPCRECGASVRYRLLRTAASLDSDADFTGNSHTEKVQ
jgi:hypothetical protein